MNGSGHAEKKREATADAEADHADPTIAVGAVADPIDHVLHGVDSIALAALNIQEETGQTLDAASGQQIRRDRQITKTGQPVRYPPDIVVESEYLVEHNDAGPGTWVGGHRQIPGNRIAWQVQSQVAAHVPDRTASPARMCLERDPRKVESK